MCNELESLIAKVYEIYQVVFFGSTSKIDGGERLWDQFETASVAATSLEVGAERRLREVINEMAVAKFLCEDHTIAGLISYEPEILASGRRIDFVVQREHERICVEVKSIYPNQPDTAETWARYVQLREYHPENVNFVVEEEWMGGSIYANTFAARGKFLEYSLKFEERLEEARQDAPGPGILVLCGSGFHWRRSDLEDFSDFYHLGKHRSDDPFALMEQHHIESKGLELHHNIDHFAFLKRASSRAEITRMYFPVLGPKLGR